MHEGLLICTAPTKKTKINIGKKTIAIEKIDVERCFQALAAESENQTGLLSRLAMSQAACTELYKQIATIQGE